MAITTDLLREHEVDEKTIQKVFGAKKQVCKLVIKVPNGSPDTFDHRVARNPDQVESWLGTPGAEVVY